MDEGYIKFNQQWSGQLLPDGCDWQTIEVVRSYLHNQKLIGVYKDGIGYGNVSQRHAQNEFIITGTATGAKANLSVSDFALVTDYDLEENSVASLGQTPASSESLTHAAIYELDQQINGVIHIHSIQLWSELINKVPTTPKAVAYGTVAMAKSVQELWKHSTLPKEKILVMAGHTEGIFTFGSSLDQAFKVLKNYLT
jgi:ribulose-5-phosphate 4-epimerase/fuculose-1-phosphate aldolase